MRLSRVFSLLVLLFSFLFVRAQDNCSLQIKVLDSLHFPLASAMVELRRLPDSAWIKTQATDTEGIVLFAHLKAGLYVCKASFPGFSTAISAALPVQGNVLNVAPLVLLSMAKEMSGVTVTARKQWIERKPGKTVVNLETSITDAGTTAMEAIEKMPGISVDKDGNLSIKGRTGVLVLIDGKQTYLDPVQLALLLNGMSASQISQVEILDQSSAADEASGSAGVINIKTKKSQLKGFNGAFTTAYAQGFYPKINNNLQLNFRSGKWNFFGNYTANFNTAFSRINAFRTYLNPNGAVAAYLDQPSFFNATNQTQNLRTGLDVNLPPKTTVGLTFTGLSLRHNGSNTNQAIWLSPQRMEDSIITTKGTNTNNWKNGGASLNFRHAFTPDRELSMDLDLLGYQMRGSQYFENVFNAVNGYSELIKASVPSDISIRSAKIDYTEQGKAMKLETGLKASHISTDNLADYQQKDGSGWRQDFGKTNHFLYRENIRSAYANASTKLKKWNVQGGLRFEATSYEADQLGNRIQNDSSFTRSYNSLFPSLQTSFTADSNHLFSLLAARRIDRPAFQKLNPFVLIINKYTLQRGNPYYRPQYTWNIEFSHLYKNRFLTGIGYSLTTDYFSQIFPQSNSGLIIYTEGNLGRLQQYTASLGAQLAPTAWWSFSSQLVAIHKEMEGVIGEKMHASMNQLTANTNHQFKFQKGWSGELTALYSSRSQTDIQEVLDPSGQVSAGLAKNVFDNKATIKLAVRDVFYTQWLKGETSFPGATETFKITRDTRVAMLSFSYRFGKSYKTGKQSEGSAADEIRRVGNN